MLLSSSGITSCSSNEELRKDELNKTIIEVIKASTPKFAEDLKVQTPTFLNKDGKKSTVKAPKEQKEATAPKPKLYYPDKDKKKSQELISKLKFSFEDPQIAQIANKFVTNLPQQVKLIKEEKDTDMSHIFGDRITYNFYSNENTSKKLASIRGWYHKDHTQLDYIIFPSDKNISKLSETIHLDVNGIEMHRNYHVFDSNGNEKIAIHRSPNLISLTKYDHKQIPEKSSNYPPKYKKVWELYKKDSYKNQQRNNINESFERYILPAENEHLPSICIAGWEKRNSKLSNSHEMVFSKDGNNINYEIKTFYSDIGQKTNKSAKLKKIGDKHFLLKFEQKNDAGDYFKINSLNQDYKKVTDNHVHSPYQISMKDEYSGGREITAQIKFPIGYFVKSSSLQHNSDFNKLESAFSHKSLIESEKEPSLDLGAIKNLEINPHNNKDLKITIENNENHTIKTVSYKGKDYLKHFYKTNLNSNDKEILSHLKEYYDNKGRLSSVIMEEHQRTEGQGSITKQEYRIIHTKQTPIIFKVQEIKHSQFEESTKNRSFSQQISSEVNGHKVSEFTKDLDSEDEKYFAPNGINKTKQEIIDNIEPGIDSFLNTVLAIYQDDINEYGALKDAVKSVLKKELRKSLDEHLSTDNIKDEYTGFIAYAKAIEGIKKFFISLCTENDWIDGKAKSKLTSKIENSIPKIPFTTKYILDPKKIEKIMRKIYHDLDITIIPAAYEVLAQRCFNGNASNSQKAITEFQQTLNSSRQSFKKQVKRNQAK